MRKKGLHCHFTLYGPALNYLSYHVVFCLSNTLIGVAVHSSWHHENCSWSGNARLMHRPDIEAATLRNHPEINFCNIYWIFHLSGGIAGQHGRDPQPMVLEDLYDD